MSYIFNQSKNSFFATATGKYERKTQLRKLPKKLNGITNHQTMNLAKLSYFTNPDVPEIRGFPLLSHHLHLLFSQNPCLLVWSPPNILVGIWWPSKLAPGTLAIELLSRHHTIHKAWHVGKMVGIWWLLMVASKILFGTMVHWWLHGSLQASASTRQCRFKRTPNHTKARQLWSFSILANHQLMVNCWFGLLVWIPGIPENERDCYLGLS